MAFWRKNLAFSQLAIVTNLEYRFNFFIDAYLQPLITVGIEILLWIALFEANNSNLIGGFTKEAYLAYGVWAPFLGRVAISWMYESMMVEDVASGNINIVLTRPISFYEYYLSQLMGYKVITTFLSLLVPLFVSFYFKLPVQYDKIPLALTLVFFYLFLLHTMSFIVSSIAFFITKVRSFTLIKNLSLFVLAGELVPFDLMPETLKIVLTALPFSSGVYIPVAYITGRIDHSVVMNGFVSVFISLILFSIVARIIWKKGLLEYTGTGA
jgi:ABC-2 type transport system permease protein